MNEHQRSTVIGSIVAVSGTADRGVNEPGRPRFDHGVASGDPTMHQVVIWTRVSGVDDDLVEVRWTVAADPLLLDVIVEGRVVTSAAKDWTVHVDVKVLEAGSTYYYGFAVGTARSTVGRTRTLPSADASSCRFAVVSCAKYNAGFFNAYSRIAARDDLDFVLHLGDYIYEAANVPPAGQTPGADIGRPFDPLHECRTTADYRRRYAQYRTDPDLQALHASHPMMNALDDHEFADGAWRGGADNHDDDRDGPWSARRAAAFAARWEWLPARKPDPRSAERVHRSVRIGDLAEMFLLDYRSRRDQPMAGPAMHHPSRTALGAEQRAWFVDGIATSDAHWRLVATPSPFCRTWQPGLDRLHAPMRALKLMHPSDDAVDEDQWDGYPAERDLLLHAIAAAGVGTSMILAGDLHVSMASELGDPWDSTPTAIRGPAVVEVATPSVTSQNLDEKRHWQRGTHATAVGRELVGALPDLQWCELESHGYVVADVTAERIVVQWWFVDTVLQRTDDERLGNEIVVVHGEPSVGVRGTHRPAHLVGAR